MNNLFSSLKELQTNNLLILPFKKIWLDPKNGSDYRNGKTLDTAVKTLAKAYALATAGQNDTILLVTDGTTASTARVDSAFTWAKNQTHLIGVAVDSLFSPRARIAPTGSTTAFANFFTVTATDCLFSNISIYQDFNTDTTNQIALTLSSALRNVFKNCHIAGIAKGDDAGGRVLKLAASEENVFEDCVIGLDTIDRNAANATIEFTTGSARNFFKHCIFPFRATATSPLLVKTAAAASLDRFNVFEECIVWNHGTSTIAGLCTMAASSGGFLAFIRPSLLNAITGFGTDATTRGQIVITGPTDGSTVSGKGYAPSA